MIFEMDYGKVFNACRQYYDTVPLIRRFIDLHYTLSLDKSVVQPEQSEDWLMALSKAVLDYWKVGELYLGLENDQIVYCDPAGVEILPGSTPSDDGMRFGFPELWSRKHKHDPIFIINRESKYDLRGTPIAYRPVTYSAKMQAIGQAVDLDRSNFGFVDSKSSQETFYSIATKIGIFRRKLGQALNLFWPKLEIDMYVIAPSDVSQAAKKFGFV